MSAQVCESLPGISSALTELRRTMDIAIFRWPCTAGGVPAGPSWREVAEAMADTIEAEAANHGRPVTLLAMPDAAPLFIAAIPGHEASVAGFISASIHFSNGTLRALGMTALVDFLNSAARTSEAAEEPSGSHARRFLRFAMDEGSEEDIEQAAAHVDATIDWGCWDSFFQTYHEGFNLMALSPLPVVPTLYLDPPSKVYAGGEKVAVFTRLFPHAEVQQLTDWPARLQDANSGHELAGKVIAYLRRDATRKRR